MELCTVWSYMANVHHAKEKKFRSRGNFMLKRLIFRSHCNPNNSMMIRLTPISLLKASSCIPYVSYFSV
jgi:hypothetical protein